MPRWLMLLLSTACASVLVGCCCGSTTYSRSTYEGQGGDFSSDRGRAYLVMGATHTTARTSGADSEDVYREPYTLEVGFDTTNEYPEPVRVLAAKIVHQGTTIVVHDRASEPLEDTLVFDAARGLQVARIEMPLGDSLPFVEGTTAEVTVVVDLPWEEAEVTLERTFVGQFSESTGTLLDAWMGI